MPTPDQSNEHTIRETAYYIWEQEGRPDGRAQDHWLRAIEQAGAPGPVVPPAPPPRKSSRRVARRVSQSRHHEPDPLEDEEKVLAGRQDANMPAMLTKDVPGG